MRYDPKTIEAKWQERWLEERTYEPDFKRARKPFYNLMMFPYPSAEGLHVGNMYAFTGADIYGRFKRMQSYDVFEPIGLDGFGIHSENYALSIGKHPADQAKISEKRFYKQLKMLGNGFAWEERLETYDSEYYRWTQWIFVQMFKRGLAYRKKAAVNWCPSCLTVLADEQVMNGECERCATRVVKKELEQWFFKITAYAERLLKNLEKIDWSERIKIAQRNWIGKSEGSLIDFSVVIASPARSGTKQSRRDRRGLRPRDDESIEVFTTRPDTLFGATYMVLGPEHELISKILSRAESRDKNQISNIREVEEYATKAKAKTEEERIAEGREKTGVELKGIKAINPANGEEIPVWVADYVLGDVGTGAIMAVPGHDERDFEFAKKFNLPIRNVIEPVYTQTTEPGKVVKGLPFDHRDAIIAIVKHWAEEKYIGLKWKKVAWGTFITGGVEEGQTPEEAAKIEIREETGYLTPRLVKDFGMVHGKFYHVPKKLNRFAHAHVLYFKLQNGDQEEVSEIEQEAHEVLWLTLEGLRKFLTPDTHQHSLRMLTNIQGAYAGEGILADSGEFTGMDSEMAKWEITKFVGGERKVQYRLRDWLISRQRYWGPPIPIIYCRKCWETRSSKSEIRNLRYGVDYAIFDGEEFIIHPVSEKDLPVVLPYIKDFRPTGSTYAGPLAAHEEFYKVGCPECGSEAYRETDVSDTFLDSAWYYLRYPSARDSRNPWNPDITKRWFPVDMYIGGAEHAVLHLLYVRFLAMVFHDWGLTDFEEPFKKFRAHGLLIKDGAKMSKSRGNVVNPDEYIKAYGADALRMYLMFLGPFEQGGDFRDTGIRGVTRFLERVWKFTQRQLPNIPNPRLQTSNKSQMPNSKTPVEIDRITHRTIKKVADDIEGLRYNTAISALMVLLNTFEEHSETVRQEHVSQFSRLLAPFAPHITEELWHEVLGEPESIHRSPWPQSDERYLKEETQTIVVQVNGRVRDRLIVPADADEASVRERALAQPKIQLLTKGQEIKKFIYVPGRVVNLVIG